MTEVFIKNFEIPRSNATIPSPDPTPVDRVERVMQHATDKVWRQTTTKERIRPSIRGLTALAPPKPDFMASSLETAYTGSSGTTFEAFSQDIEAIDTLIAATRKEAARFRNTGPSPVQTQAPPKIPTPTNRKRKATQNLLEGTQHSDQVEVDNTKLMLNQILMKMGEILNNQHKA